MSYSTGIVLLSGSIDLPRFTTIEWSEPDSDKARDTMRITRLYSGPDGESHFEDVDLPMQVGPTGRATRTEILSARGIMFFDAGDSEYHKAPPGRLSSCTGERLR